MLLGIFLSTVERYHSLLRRIFSTVEGYHQCYRGVPSVLWEISSSAAEDVQYYGRIPSLLWRHIISTVGEYRQLIEGYSKQ